MFPAALGIVVQTFPLRRREKALALFLASTNRRSGAGAIPRSPRASRRAWYRWSPSTPSKAGTALAANRTVGVAVYRSAYGPTRRVRL
jgi:hypothetical protein